MFISFAHTVKNYSNSCGKCSDPNYHLPQESLQGSEGHHFFTVHIASFLVHVLCAKFVPNCTRN